MKKHLNAEFIDLLTQDAIDVWPKHFNEYEEVFNKCCFAICLDIIKRFGLFKKVGEEETYDSICKKVGIASQAEYLFNKILYILIEEGVLEFTGVKYISRKTVDMEGAAELLVSVTRQYPGEGAPFQWLARAYSGMYDFITGKVYPEDIMFPWGSFELVEDVYYSSEVYGFYSKLAGRTIRHLVEQVYQDNVTMLEVGAGTGNGTAHVFEWGAAKFAKYYFTDISRSLLKGSKKRFEQYQFIDYKLFDITKEYKEQGFEPNSIDIILAVNVLHATDNVFEVVKSLRTLLKEGGSLVIAEIAPPPGSIYRYMELTFGLLPSYNSYKDKEERPVSCIIRPEQWVEIFRQAGFIECEAVPYDKAGFSDRGGVVIGTK